MTASKSRGEGVRKILIGYDGSEPSARAVDLVLYGLAGPATEVWIVHATDPPKVVAEPLTDEERGVETDAIAESLEAIRAGAGPRVHVWTREGAASDVLLAAAEELRVDLIVVGTRGLRGARRLMLGSVSNDVVARSSRPVTVVP